MVMTRGGSDDRERIEELEASVAALKAHVVTHDQVRDIEAAQRELSDTLNTLSEETRDAMGIIQRVSRTQGSGQCITDGNGQSWL